MASKPIRLKIKSAEIRIEDVRLRMPFKFGIATLTEVPKLTMRVIAEDMQGHSAIGYSSDMLPALWFDKAPEKTIEQKVDDQITMASLACDEYVKRSAEGVTPFELWWAVYPVLKKGGADRGINPLTAGFGSSFAERATIDAACRLASSTFFDAVKSNSLGIEAHQVHHELAGFNLASALPARPLDHIWCRHTVGLGDPLRVADIKPEERVNDGLPQALEEDMDVYGLKYFKVKIDGDRERNLSRLSAMAEIICAKRPDGFVVTLDGNEQVKSLDDVEWLFAGLRKTAAGAKFVDTILFVEQPLGRDVSLSPDHEAAIRSFSRVKPLIIDESDNDVTSLLQARDVGYAGISAKNCKGVFKAILNKCLLAKWNREGPNSSKQTVPYILSSEDLTNTGVIALQQDFATLTTLGIEHSERNGHHYFRGLAHLSEGERECSLRTHPDLYERKAGTVALKIKDGVIQLGSIQTSGYGYNCEVDFDRRLKIEAWRKKG